MKRLLSIPKIVKKLKADVECLKVKGHKLI